MGDFQDLKAWRKLSLDLSRVAMLVTRDLLGLMNGVEYTGFDMSVTEILCRWSAAVPDG